MDNLTGVNHKTQFRMTVKPGTTSGRFQGAASTIITLNQESNYVPKEESFPVPLRYIDVTRATHIILDVLQESRIDYFWNIDGIEIRQSSGKDSHSSPD